MGDALRITVIATGFDRTDRSGGAQTIPGYGAYAIHFVPFALRNMGGVMPQAQPQPQPQPQPMAPQPQPQPYQPQQPMRQNPGQRSIPRRPMRRVVQS
jgi:hypothetical protein